MPRADIARLLNGPAGRAVLAWRQYPHRAVAFAPAPGFTTHVRHERKYDQCGAEAARRLSPVIRPI